MRVAPREKQGYFGFCGLGGCALLLLVLLLPVSTCFGGSRVKGYEAAAALGGLVLHGRLLAILPIYATCAAALGIIALVRGRVSGASTVAVAIAPLAAIGGTSIPVQVGYVVWLVAVCATAVAVIVMYSTGHRLIG